MRFRLLHISSLILDLPTMGKKKDAAEIIKRANERGAAQDSEIIDGKKTFKKLQPAVERCYEAKIELWIEYNEVLPQS